MDILWNDYRIIILSCLTAHQMNLLFPKRFLYLFVFLVVFTIALGSRSYDDTHGYRLYIEKITDRSVVLPDPATIAIFPYLTNPAMMLSIAGLGTVTGSDALAWSIINIILYAVAVFFFFNAARLLFDEEISLCATALFGTNYFLITFGPGAYLVEMGGWTFLVITLFFALKFYRTQSPRYAYWGGFFSMAGFLFKESGGMGFFAVTAAILLSGLSSKDKVRVLLGSASFFLVTIAWHLGTYITQSYSYLDRYSRVAQAYGPHRSLYLTAKVMGSLFFLGWPLVALAAIGKMRRAVSLAPIPPTAYLLPLLPGLTFLIYPAVEPRIAAIALPFLALAAASGLLLIPRRWGRIIIVVVIVATNLTMPYFLRIINPDRFLEHTAIR